MKTYSDSTAGWANLAAAVVMSGIQQQDESFLKSDWCQTLVDLSLSHTRTDDKQSYILSISRGFKYAGNSASFD